MAHAITPPVGACVVVVRFRYQGTLPPTAYSSRSDARTYSELYEVIKVTSPSEDAVATLQGVSLLFTVVTGGNVVARLWLYGSACVGGKVSSNVTLHVRARIAALQRVRGALCAPPWSAPLPFSLRRFVRAPRRRTAWSTRTRSCSTRAVRGPASPSRAGRRSFACVRSCCTPAALLAAPSFNRARCQEPEPSAH